MPKIRREATVPLPLELVWDFVSDMNNWAADMPGYITHQMLSDRQSIWRLRGDVGILSREVELLVNVIEWNERSSIGFTVKGTQEPVSGRGSLEMVQESQAETGLAFHMELTAGSVMGPLINALLTKVAPRVADDFVSALSAHLLAEMA